MMKYLLLSITAFLISACNGVDYLGSEYNNFAGAPNHPISISKAIDISQPYLDKTFELRIKERSNSSTQKPVIWVSVKGDWYYLVKDNYPSYTPGFYIKHAVRVNVKTGELLEPE